MLHYNPRHVSSIDKLVFRRTNYIITASGIVTLCKRLYSMPDESRLQSALIRHTVLYCTVQRVTIQDAVIIEISLYYDARSKKHKKTNIYLLLSLLLWFCNFRLITQTSEVQVIVKIVFVFKLTNTVRFKIVVRYLKVKMPWQTGGINLIVK